MRGAAFIAILLVATAGLPSAALAAVSARDLRCNPGDARLKYREKPDFAALESNPETRVPEQALKALMPADLEALDQECIDRVYASLASGPIPALGPLYEGHAFSPDGGGFKALLEQLIPTSGVKAVLGRMMEWSLGEVQRSLVGAMIFSRIPGGDKDHPQYKANTVRTSRVLKRTETIFPARVYCGQSLIDSRRESIVIDPAYADDFSDFKKGTDEVPGRKGLNLREEIRMVRPGFYLGRVYGARVYLMSFSLYNAKEDQAGVDRGNECWLGTQARLR